VMSTLPSSASIEADSGVIACSLGQPERFAAVFDRHYASVHRYLARRAGAQMADEVASATFVVAFERRASFRPESTSAQPWLLGIATKLLQERRRDDARRTRLTMRLVAQPDARSYESPSGGHGDARGETLARALATLDDGQREALLLYAWAELSYEEIADALGVPVGTVRSRLSRARAHLRSQLAMTNTTLEETP